MTPNEIFGTVLGLLIIAGVLNLYIHQKNQTKAEAMTFISWLPILFAILLCIYGLWLKK
jgi:hypothetical protein